MAPSKFERRQSDMMRRIDFSQQKEGNPLLAAILGALGLYAGILLLFSL